MAGLHQDHGHGGAGSRAAEHLTYNQAPAYIRGPGPLDLGDRALLLLPLDNTALGAL
jgi:hypothetical protein